MSLLNITSYDQEFYNMYLKDFLPDNFIDCHNHIWLARHVQTNANASRCAAWPEMVAKDNSIEDLIQTNLELFPGKTVTPVLYSYVNVSVNTKESNQYVQECSKKYNFPALYLSRPEENIELIEKNVLEGGFSGLKVYLEFAPEYIPAN